MPYAITRADLASITDVEMAFSADRLLSAWDDIPNEFKRSNIYTQVADALFDNSILPAAEMTFLDGFDDEQAPAHLNRCVRAHLQSYGPTHEHKIAGVGYMISKVCRIEPAEA
jgi:hypothetical protein